MNILSIELEPSSQGDDLGLIKIDGHDFIELVKDIELPLAQNSGEKNLAGAYEYLPIHLMRYPSLLLLGGEIPPELEADNTKRILLDCPCGELGCWPLQAQVSLKGDYVEWSHFEQPNRSAWVFPDSFKFMFSKYQLSQAIRV